jgi:hypothetical protein
MKRQTPLETTASFRSPTKKNETKTETEGTGRRGRGRGRGNGNGRGRGRERVRGNGINISVDHDVVRETETETETHNITTSPESAEQRPSDLDDADIGGEKKETEPTTSSPSVISTSSLHQENEIPMTIIDTFLAATSTSSIEVARRYLSRYSAISDPVEITERALNTYFADLESDLNNGLIDTYLTPRRTENDRGETEEDDPRRLIFAQNVEFEETLRADQAKEEEKRRAEEEQERFIRRLDEEMERKRAVLMSVLPPSEEDENAVTIIIREPDGERFIRRFFSDDALLTVFDAIDVERGKYAPGSYDLVSSFPRKRFREQEVSEKGTRISDHGCSLNNTVLLLVPV